MKIRLFYMTFFVICFFTQSCTLIGLTIGAISDSKKSDEKVDDARHIPSMIGSECLILLKNNQQVSGTITKVEREDATIYHEYYVRSLEKNNCSDLVPAIGDRIWINLNSGVIWQGRLVGFDLNTLVYHSGQRVKPHQINLNSVISIEDSHHNIYNRAELQNLSYTGKLPFLSRITLLSDQYIHTIPLDSVVYLKTPAKKNGMITGAIVGGVIDIGFMVYGISQMRKTTWISF